jgi:Tfp pilus assembly protein PilE
MSHRRAATLVELLVVIAIISILIGMLLAAIVQVRNAAIRTESKNKLRQIILATQHFADTRDSRLPTLDGDRRSPNRDVSLFWALLPYLEEGNLMREFKASKQSAVLNIFLSPADPSLPEVMDKNEFVSSYPANGQLFVNSPRMAASIPDGTSQTIAFGEHYAFGCDGVSYYLFSTAPGVARFGHRASFADSLCADAVPLTSGNPPTSQSNYPDLTFQVAPKRQNCNSYVPQTPHGSGMLAALADGSVRSLSPGMSPGTFWAAVTPAGNEVLGDDW